MKLTWIELLQLMIYVFHVLVIREWQWGCANCLNTNTNQLDWHYSTKNKSKALILGNCPFNFMCVSNS